MSEQSVVGCRVVDGPRTPPVSSEAV